MTREEVIRMAREVGGTVMQPFDYGAKPDRMILMFDALERFAALVAAAERKECIRICMDMNKGWCSDDHLECATAIRARGEK